MLLERGKKKTGKGKVVPNAQNSVLRGLGKVMGILSFFLGKGEKNTSTRANISLLRKMHLENGRWRKNGKK